MNRLALPFALLLLAVDPLAAAPPNPKDLVIPAEELSRARDLVSKLASEDFEEREDAQDSLAKMGRLAMPALLEGLNANPSPEVRFRCQSLLPKAAHEDLQSRLATFMADVDGQYEHDLPGWNEFHKIAGAGAASRGVFVELLKEPANRAIVLAIAGPPGDLGNLIAARKQAMYQMRFPRPGAATAVAGKEQSVPDAIVLMFAESQIASRYVPRSVSTTTIYNIASLTSAVTDGSDKAPVYKAIVGHWIETRDDAISMYTAMNQATNMRLTKQGGAVAAKLVQLKGGALTYRFYAAFAIARSGTKENLPALEAVFTDEAGLNQNRVVNGMVQMTSMQMRDMALVAALLLTGQNAEEYGFVEQYKNQAGMQYTYSNWRLPEEKRQEAFDKWKAWRAKNSDFGKVKSEK